MALTLIKGAEGTGNESGNPSGTSINQTQKVLQVDEKIHLLDSDNNPLVVFLKKTSTKPVAGPIFRWQEDRFEPKSVTINATASALLDNGTDTAFSLPAGEENYLTVGDLLLFSGTAGVSPNQYDEIVLVTAVASNGLDITIVRNFGARSSAWAGTPANAAFTGYINGSAFEEGSLSADAKAVKTSFVSNYTQIFKDSISVTGTEDATELYGGNERGRQRRKKSLKHMRDMERAFIVGQPKEDVTTGSYARRSTGGILYFISTNVTDAAGTINYATWVNFAKSAFRYGESKTRLLLCSAEVVSAIALMAHNQYFAMTPEKTYGVSTNRITTPYGDFLVVYHKQFSEMGLAGYAISLDMADVAYRPLRGRDTKLSLDVQANDSDIHKDQLLTEAGLAAPLEERQAVLKGVTGFAP